MSLYESKNNSSILDLRGYLNKYYLKAVTIYAIFSVFFNSFSIGFSSNPQQLIGYIVAVILLILLVSILIKPNQKYIAAIIFIYLLGYMTELFASRDSSGYLDVDSLIFYADNIWFLYFPAYILGFEYNSEYASHFLKYFSAMIAFVICFILTRGVLKNSNSA